MFPPDTVNPQMSRRASIPRVPYTPIRATPTTMVVNGKDKTKKPDPARPLLVDLDLSPKTVTLVPVDTESNASVPASEQKGKGRDEPSG